MPIDLPDKSARSDSATAQANYRAAECVCDFEFRRRPTYVQSGTVSGAESVGRPAWACRKDRRKRDACDRTARAVCASAAALVHSFVLGGCSAPFIQSHAAGSASGPRRPTAGACCACERSGAARGKERRPSSATSRTVPNLVTMAMNGWADAEPAWWLNLQAHPDVTVDLPGGSRAVHGTCRGRGRAAAPVGQAGRLRQGSRRLRGTSLARDRGRDPVAPTRAVRREESECEPNDRRQLRGGLA